MKFESIHLFKLIWDGATFLEDVCYVQKNVGSTQISLKRPITGSFLLSEKGRRDPLSANFSPFPIPKIIYRDSKYRYKHQMKLNAVYLAPFPRGLK